TKRRPPELPGVAVAPDEVPERLALFELWPAVEALRSRVGPQHRRHEQHPDQDRERRCVSASHQRTSRSSCSSRTAVCSNRASSPWLAVSCSPSGSASPTGIGMLIAGVPSAVHGLFIRESPVDVNPRGAGPGAAGTSMTGVAL